MYLLSIITITKNDPIGEVQTLDSTSALRLRSEIEQLVVFAGDCTTNVGDESVLRVRQKSDGIADAFNTGLAHARGEWIWFLNGGDTVHPNLDGAWLLKLLTTTKADMVTGGIQYAGDSDFRPVPPLRLQWPMLYCWPAHPATLVRRKTLLASGEFDPKLEIAMDFDLWMRLLLSDPKIDVISIPLAVFDVSGVSQRPKMQQQVRRETAAVLRRYSCPLVRLWLGMGKRLFVEICRAWRNALRPRIDEQTLLTKK